MSIPLREKLTLALLDDLRLRKKTNAEVAKSLNVSPQYLSNVFNQLTDGRIPGPTSVYRLAEKKLVEARRAVRIREAKKVINKTKDLKTAAKTANCSERTLRRYVIKIAPKQKTEAYE